MRIAAKFFGSNTPVFSTTQPHNLPLMQVHIKRLFLAALVVFPGLIWAQTGTIKGSIKDEATDEEVIGATIMLQGTGVGTVTDFDGNYIIKNIKPGTYNLVFSYLSYKTDTLTGVKVVAGQTTTVHQKMKEDAAVFEEVVILGVQQKNTEEAVIKEVKEAEQVVSAVSSEQIEKSVDKDAAQVIRRIPGVTLIDGRFVMVRGLAQRYNAVLLNGALAPSTEPESKTFSFDVISSSMIDRLLLYKSGSSDLPGEFAGSVIQLYTKSTPNEDYFKIGISGGYRHGTTFKEGRRDSEANTGDMMAFGNNNRAWPTTFNQRIPGENPLAGAALATQLSNDYFAKSTTTMPDFGISVQGGKKFMLFGKDMSTVNELSYSNNNYYREMRRNKYFGYKEDGSSSIQFLSDDREFENEVTVSGLSNWSLLLNQRNRIDFRNFYTRIGNSEITERHMIDSLNRREQDNISLRYLQRAIYSNQTSGSHTLRNDATNISWVVGYSNIQRNEPNWRRAVTQRNLGTNDPFIVPFGSPNQFVRFNSDLTENIYMHRLDFTHELKYDTTEYIKFKAGYYIDNASRDFRARLIEYRTSPGGNFNNDIRDLPLDQLLNQENIGFPNGLILAEATTPKDQYTAGYTTMSGHFGFNSKYQMFALSAGLRLESYTQSLTANDGSVDVDTVWTKANLLPSINGSMDITDKMLIRAGYSKTLNRPALREIAPFQFYDFALNAQVSGNPELRICEINNYDVRWELYPSANEALSVGAFYKEFKNPIEMIYLQLPDPNYFFKFINGVDARSYGLEVEARKSAQNLFTNPILQRFSVLLNASYIYSRIDVGDNIGGLDKNRPMQGQSPYVINAALFYSDEEKGWDASIQYNVYGQRIFFVGDVQTRTVYEMPRHLVDISVSKKVTEKLQLKAGVSDLLNAPFNFREDSDYNGKADSDIDRSIIYFRRGTKASLGLSYTF